jgi:hypothetical protein
MTREEEMIADYESAMNARLSDRDKELMISVLQWADNHPITPQDKATSIHNSPKMKSMGLHKHTNYNR